ncbi:MAG: hypothetical protein OEZ54_00690 [Gemmatimonadota bacterium]|nr:hypothetical protein [Gemmatimonadota bacterium]
MTDPFPTKDLVRVIFERGLQILRSDDRWIIPSSLGLATTESLEEFQIAIDARPIIYDTQFEVPFFQPRRVLDPEGMPVSRSRYLKGYVEESDRRVYKYLVEHHLFCAVAHLGYLAEAYGALAVLHNENRWGLPEYARSPSLQKLKDSAWRHGEAVFAALLSAFDASVPLTDKAPPRAPPSFEKAIEVDRYLGDWEILELMKPLRESWAKFGPSLVYFRNFSAEHGTLDTAPKNFDAYLNETDAWEVRLRLPGPFLEFDSRKAESDLNDMLNFAWLATCDFVRSIESSLPLVFLKRQRLIQRTRWRRIKDAYGFD